MIEIFADYNPWLRGLQTLDIAALCKRRRYAGTGESAGDKDP